MSRTTRLAATLGCSLQDAQYFLELGYSNELHALFAAGLRNPIEPIELIEVYDDFVVTSPTALGES